MKTITTMILSVLCLGLAMAQPSNDPSVVQYKFPITFIENVGQWNPAVLFGNLLADQKAYLMKDGIALPGKREAVRAPGETPTDNPGFTYLHFVNPSKKMKVSGKLPMAAKSNFYQDSDKSKWREGVTNFEKVVYSNVWKDIDVEYGEENGRLTQKFIVNPGGKISDIRLRNATDESSDSIPFFRVTKSYCEDKNGVQTPFEAAIKNFPSGTTSVYTRWRDTTKRIILNTEFSTYQWTGSVTSSFLVGRQGQLYTTGLCQNSADFPLVRSGVSSSSYEKPETAYLAKLLCDGKTLDFSTFIPCQWAAGYDADKEKLLFGKDGSVFVALGNASIHFPTTPDAILKTQPDSATAQLCSGICRVDETGKLLYGSYFYSISAAASDRFGSVYLACDASRWTWWRGSKHTVAIHCITPNVVKSAARSNMAPFLVKLTPECDKISYGTFIGPDYKTYMDSAWTGVNALAVDDSCNAIVVGTTTNSHLPLKNAYQNALAGLSDAFIMKLNSTATDYVFSTYFGGGAIDFAGGKINYDYQAGVHDWVLGESNFSGNRVINISKSGDIYFLGMTASADYPLKNPLAPPFRYFPSDNGNFIQYIARFSSNGELKYSTTVGGVRPYSDTRMGWAKCTGSFSLDEANNMYLSGGTVSSYFPFIKPMQTLDVVQGINYFSVIDSGGGSVKFSSAWGQYCDPGTGTPFQIYNLISPDEAGYIYMAGSPNNVKIDTMARLFPTFNAFLDTATHGTDGFLTRIFLPFCGQDYLSGAVASIAGLDTIEYAENRGYYVSKILTVTVAVHNNSSDRAAENVRIELQLPDCLTTWPVSQSLSQFLQPSVLPPGMTDSVTFTVKTDSLAPLNTSPNIKAFIEYRIPGMVQECPLPTVGAKADVPVKLITIPYPEVSCSISAPDSLVVDSTSHAYEANPFQVQCSIHNVGKGDAHLKNIQIRIPKGMNLVPIPQNDTIRALSLLRAGESRAITWLLSASPRVAERMAGISFVITDNYDSINAVCSTEIYVPAVPPLACSVSSPDTVRFDGKSGQYLPDPLRVILNLHNLLDTLVPGIEAKIDLSGAPQLIIAAGDTADKQFPGIWGGKTVPLVWDVTVASDSSAPTQQLIVVRYRSAVDSVWKECSHVIIVMPGTRQFICSLGSKDSLSLTPDGDGFQDIPFPFTYTIKNVGTAWISLIARLTLTPANIFHAIEDSVQALKAMSPNQTDSLFWHLLPSTSRFDRVVDVLVSAMDSSDNQVSSCLKSIFLPGITNDLACSLVAPDTLHYDVATDTYTPNPFACILTLDNKLDTAQQIIETMIDLSAAPHLKLASGEQAQKQIATIAAHAPESVAWQLEVASSSQTPITESIIVTFRHQSDTAYRTCQTNILIEGQKRIFAASCATAGHDSIWLLEDRTIPSVAQVQYMITNTGNVTLTGCSAAILLPPMFYCSNSADSIQSFGIIQPGTSASRQWLIAVNYGSAQLTQQTIRWSWSCDSMKSIPPCEHSIQPALGEPSRIIINPWKLRFRAKQNGALPSAQQVEMHEAPTTSIFWQLQSATPWIDFQPTSGSQTSMIDVRPNTTALPVAVYSGAISVSPAGFVSPQSSIEVEYEIYLTTPTDQPAQPPGISLEQNYPNPVSGKSFIRFTLPDRQWVTLSVYDALGRQVRVLSSGTHDSGEHVTQFDANGLPAGVYTYVMRSGNVTILKRAVVVR